jgi:hypothetical protein
MTETYTFEEAAQIIDHYNQLTGTFIRTSQTPNFHPVEGTLQRFIPLPVDPKTGSYETFLLSYQMAPFQDEWLKARKRENRRWTPFVVINEQYLPWIPIAKNLPGGWSEDWRKA